MSQNINLYERPAARARGLWSREGVAALATLVVLGAAVIAFIDRRGADAARAETEHAAKEAARLEQLLAQVPSAASAQSEKLNSEEREVIALETIAARLSSGALGRAGSFTEHLRALGRATADGVWLTAIKVNHTTGTLTLEGKALDASRVPALIDALGRQPLFAGTQFAAIEVKADDGDVATKSNSLVRFRITSGDNQRRNAPAAADATQRAAPKSDAARSAPTRTEPARPESSSKVSTRHDVLPTLAAGRAVSLVVASALRSSSDRVDARTSDRASDPASERTAEHIADRPLTAGVRP
jgi:Tfp pilus assembly protein PilN